MHYLINLIKKECMLHERNFFIYNNKKLFNILYKIFPAKNWKEVIFLQDI